MHAEAHRDKRDFLDKINKHNSCRDANPMCMGFSVVKRGNVETREGFVDDGEGFAMTGRGLR